MAEPGTEIVCTRPTLGSAHVNDGKGVAGVSSVGAVGAAASPPQAAVIAAATAPIQLFRMPCPTRLHVSLWSDLPGQPRGPGYRVVNSRAWVIS